MNNVETSVPVLEAKHISKIYGKTVALSDANITVNKGEVHALLGGNGAGKSTLIGMISGAKKPDGGELLINGIKMKFHGPRDSIRNGVAVVYQELSVLPDLTVLENISMGNQRVSRGGVYDWQTARKEAVQILQLLGGPAADIDPDSLVSTLRTNQRQLVEIARAVNLGAQVILLDEPTSSLNHEETIHLFDVMRKLCTQGIGLIFVSHRLNEIREISTRVTVLRDGKTVLNGGNLSDIPDSQLVNQMSGRKVETDLSNKKAVESIYGNDILKIEYKNAERFITVKKGEVVGIAGLSGTGRSALLRNIWGAEKRNDLKIEFCGHTYRPKNPRDAMLRGIAYVGEDRRATGVLLNLSLVETLMMPKRVLKPSVLLQKDEISLANRIIDALKVKIPDLHSAPKSLSGGNQQKLLFGRWLTQKPTLLLLDEPTRGVDIATKYEIYRLVNDLTALGTSVIVVSSEVPELVTMADRVFIMNKGYPIKEMIGEEITDESILAGMTTSN